jgi:hypothetical protein
MMRWILIACLFWSNTALAKSTGCGEKVTEQGYCESATKVVWCEQQVRHNLECKKGTICAWNEVLQAFDCVSVTEDCVLNGKQVHLNGTCFDGNTLVRWCDDGKIKSLYCPMGTLCGWNDVIQMMDCVKDGCLEAPLNGMCIHDARAVRWCDDGKILEKECAETEICAFDKAANRWVCMSQESSTEQTPDNSNVGSDVSLTPPGRDDLYNTTGTDNNDKQSSGGCVAANRSAAGPTTALFLSSMGLLWWKRRKTGQTNGAL